MTVRVSKPEFNLREKITELDKPTGLKGLDLMRSDTTQDARTFTSSGRKNLVVNGQFDIWQRATDSGSNTNDGYLTADRWFHASSGATKQVTRQSFSPGQTDVPDNPKYYLRYAVTTGNNNVALRQRIEGVENVQGEMTLSFWVKGSNPGGGVFNLTFRQNFGSGGSASSVVDQGITNYSVTNYWTKKIFTFTPLSISGKTIGTTEGTSYYEIELFRQPAGDTTTTAFTVDFANVQLERGGNATEFDERSFGEELALCQRYAYRLGGLSKAYQVVGNGFIGQNGGTKCAKVLVDLPTTMRTNPSVSVIGTDSFWAHTGAAFSDMACTLTSNTGGTWTSASSGNQIWLDFGRSSGGSPDNGTACVVYTQATNQGEVMFDAEL